MKILDNNLSLKNINSILENHSILSDLLSCICGKYIGGGASRDVYEYSLDKRYVVKIISASSTPISNINEFQLYDEIRGLMGDKAWVKDWFAPVVWMSQGGNVILQRKTEKYHKNLLPPSKVPSFLYDIHRDNFGWIGNKFVCHDYGIIYGFINYNKIFKKANW